MAHDTSPFTNLLVFKYGTDSFLIDNVPALRETPTRAIEHVQANIAQAEAIDKLLKGVSYNDTK